MPLIDEANGTVHQLISGRHNKNNEGKVNDFVIALYSA